VTFASFHLCDMASLTLAGQGDQKQTNLQVLVNRQSLYLEKVEGNFGLVYWKIEKIKRVAKF